MVPIVCSGTNWRVISTDPSFALQSITEPPCCMIPSERSLPRALSIFIWPPSASTATSREKPSRPLLLSRLPYTLHTSRVALGQ